MIIAVRCEGNFCIKLEFFFSFNMQGTAQMQHCQVLFRRHPGFLSHKIKGLKSHHIEAGGHQIDEENNFPNPRIPSRSKK